VSLFTKTVKFLIWLLRLISEIQKSSAVSIRKTSIVLHATFHTQDRWNALELKKSKKLKEVKNCTLL